MTDEDTLRARHASLFELEKARERDQRPCVWPEGEVPRHVAEYLWDASYDRRRLIALVDEARAERDALKPLADIGEAVKAFDLRCLPRGIEEIQQMLVEYFDRHDDSEDAEWCLKHLPGPRAIYAALKPDRARP